MDYLKWLASNAMMTSITYRLTLLSACALTYFHETSKTYLLDQPFYVGAYAAIFICFFFLILATISEKKYKKAMKIIFSGFSVGDSFYLKETGCYYTITDLDWEGVHSELINKDGEIVKGYSRVDTPDELRKNNIAILLDHDPELLNEM